MTAIGASLQLLPVATRQPVRAHAVARARLVAVHAGRRGGRARHGTGAAVLLAPARSRSCWRSSAYARAARAQPAGRRGHARVMAHGWVASRRSPLPARRAVARVRLRRRAGPRARDGARAARRIRRLRVHGHARRSGCPTSWCRCSRCPTAPDERRALASCALAVARARCSRGRRGRGRAAGAARRGDRCRRGGGRAARRAHAARAAYRYAARTRTGLSARARRVGAARREPRAGAADRAGAPGRRHRDAVRDCARSPAGCSRSCSASCSASFRSWRRCTRRAARAGGRRRRC